MNEQTIINFFLLSEMELVHLKKIKPAFFIVFFSAENI